MELPKHQPSIHVRYIESGGNHLYMKLVADTDSVKPLCVVLPPLGEEQLVTRSVIARFMKSMLATGTPSLTFDLSHTGESTGESKDASVSAWRQDLKAVLNFASRISDCNLTIACVRHSSLLLTYLPPSTFFDCKSVTLIEPVFNGEAFRRDYEIHLRARNLRYNSMPKLYRAELHRQSSSFSSLLVNELAKAELVWPSQRPQLNLVLRDTPANRRNARHFCREESNEVSGDMVFRPAPPFWIDEKCTKSNPLFDEATDIASSVQSDNTTSKVSQLFRKLGVSNSLESAHSISIGQGQIVYSRHSVANVPAKGQVVILQGGYFCRAGAYRVLVRLARRLANNGYEVIRFDHIGVGDSEPCLTNAQSRPETVLAIQHFAFIQNRSAPASHAVLGFCDGANLALSIAHQLPPDAKLFLANTWLEERKPTWLTMVTRYHTYRSLFGALHKRTQQFPRYLLPKAKKCEGFDEGQDSKNSDLSYSHDRALYANFTAANHRLFVVTSGQDITGLAFSDKLKRWNKARKDWAPPIKSTFIDNADHTFSLDAELTKLGNFLLKELN